MNVPTAAPRVRRGIPHRARRTGLNLGRGSIAPEYLDASRVATRHRALVEEGYPAHLATLAVRLEGRENTLLDAADGAGLTAAEDAELRAVQRLLGSLAGERSALAAARHRYPRAHELDFLGADDEPLTVIYDGGPECDPDGRNAGWALDLVEVYDAAGRDVTAAHAEAAEAAIWKAAAESREAYEESLAEAC